MIVRTQIRRSTLRLKQHSVWQIQRRLVNKSADPLRILFCGADEFSIASLKALHHEKRVNPDLIESIDVVCKVGKRHGRGLKNVREVPIVAIAQELSLPLHQLETFTKWQCPGPADRPINIIIAVSFGLLIPPRILRDAKYGGLNVHPSLLPDFRGAAPVHWALLHNCKTTGITLQTLHPQHFDRGNILLQTPLPGLDIPNPESITPTELSAFLAPKGADLLVQGLRERVFSSKLESKGSSSLARPAPKITPEDRHINWSKWSAEEILRRHRVVGPLWNRAYAGSPPNLSEKRVIWSAGFEVATSPMDDIEPGLGTISVSNPYIYIRTADEHILRADTAVIEGLDKKAASVAVIRANMVDPRTKDTLGTPDSMRLWSPFS